jgi:type II secretory pathway pseudopilin PulG
MVVIGVPKYKDMQQRQQAAESGQNLKLINTAIDQWSVEHLCPPSTNGTMQVLDPSKEDPFLIPVDGQCALCDALKVYINTPFTWYSPQRSNNIPSYIYATWTNYPTSSSGNPIIRAGCFSVLDSHYGVPGEPRGFEGRDTTVDGQLIKASYANGYEDIGVWWPGTPRMNQYSPSPQTLDDYP